MGSDDNTDITNRMLTVQNPEGSSAAKTPPSHGSGGAAGRGASPPSSSPRPQEQVQNLKDQREVVVDDPTEPKDKLIVQTKVSDITEPDMTSVASVSGWSAAPTVATDGIGGGDWRRACRTWSLTEEEQVWNLKRNWRRALPSVQRYAEDEVLRILDSRWLVRIVAGLRADPYLDVSAFLEDVDVVAREHLKEFNRLHFAVLMDDLQLVQKILETRSEPNKVDINSCIRAGFSVRYSALDLAIVGGESDIVDALLQKNAKINYNRNPYSLGSLQLAVLHARESETEKTSKIIQSLIDKGIDINDKDEWGYSAFSLAVATGKTDIVLELLKWKDKIHLNEDGPLGQPPIQIAIEEGFKDIESELMKCDEVKGYIEAAFRDRRAYVDAAMPFLWVQHSSPVTFASWLQPPLNYTTSYHGTVVLGPIVF